MKKILFNDKFMLTQAVLDGRKTQTRRIIKTSDAFERVNPDFDWDEEDIKNRENDFVSRVNNMTETEKKECFNYLLNHPRYKVGEVVAVAQSYSSIVNELEDCNNATCAGHYEKNVEKAAGYISWMEHPGFNNKMFVNANKMLHQIRITNVRVERLQDILDEDCLKEGIYEDGGDDAFIPHYFYNYENSGYGGFDLPQMAYADLINRISGKRTWESNPYVFVYDFELVK